MDFGTILITTLQGPHIRTLLHNVDIASQWQYVWQVATKCQFCCWEEKRITLHCLECRVAQNGWSLRELSRVTCIMFCDHNHHQGAGASTGHLGGNLKWGKELEDRKKWKRLEIWKFTGDHLPFHPTLHQTAAGRPRWCHHPKNKKGHGKISHGIKFCKNPPPYRGPLVCHPHWFWSRRMRTG